MKVLDVHGRTRAQFLHAGAARAAAAADAHQRRLPALAAPCDRRHPGELHDDGVRAPPCAAVERPPDRSAASGTAPFPSTPPQSTPSTAVTLVSRVQRRRM